MNGTILWFDKRDGYGIAVDDKGSEYYIDTSAIPLWAHAHLNNGVRVVMTRNEDISHCRCARISWVNLDDAKAKYLSTIAKLKTMPADHLQPDAISSLESLVADIDEQYAEEAQKKIV